MLKVTLNVNTPLLNVSVSGKLPPAGGLTALVLSVTVPVSAVTVLPYASVAVTVTLNGAPTVGVEVAGLTTKCVTTFDVTVMPLLVPAVIVLFPASFAVNVRRGGLAVFNCTEKVPLPLVNKLLFGAAA